MSGNVMQRVFDALETDRGQTIDEIAHKAKAAEQSVRKAIGRLQLRRVLYPASCVDGVWLYRRRPDAIRPSDGRGNVLRQMRQEASA